MFVVQWCFSLENILGTVAAMRDLPASLTPVKMLKCLVPKTHTATQLRELMHLENFSFQCHLSMSCSMKQLASRKLYHSSYGYRSSCTTQGGFQLKVKPLCTHWWYLPEVAPQRGGQGTGWGIGGAESEQKLNSHIFSLHSVSHLLNQYKNNHKIVELKFGVIRL